MSEKEGYLDPASDDEATAVSNPWDTETIEVQLMRGSFDPPSLSDIDWGDGQSGPLIAETNAPDGHWEDYDETVQVSNLENTGPTRIRPQGFDRSGANPPQGFDRSGANPPQGFDRGGANPPQGFDRGGANLPQEFDRSGANPPQGFDQHGASLPPDVRRQQQGYRDERRAPEDTARKRGSGPTIVLAIAALVIALCSIGVFSGLIKPPANETSSEGTTPSDNARSGESESAQVNNESLSLDDIADKAVRDAFKDTVDTNGDGILSSSELDAIESLDLSGTSVGSLEDLELLDNLEKLDISDCDSLHEADFEILPSLKRLNAKGSSISDADFSANKNLEELQLDDSVVVTGLDSTTLRQQWQITSYMQNGYAGYGSEHEGDWSASFEYDSDNRLAKRNLSESGTSNSATTSEYSYDSSGNLVSEVQYDNNGNVLSDLRCTRDSHNISVERFSSLGSLVKGYYGIFDAQGRVAHISLANSDFTVDYEYDGDNHLVRALYHESGSNYANRFEYSNGNLVLEDDALSPSARDIRYEYDDQGRCNGRSILSADGSQLIDSAAFSYDEDGRIECNGVTLSFDRHGNIVGRTIDQGGSRKGRSEITYRRIFTSKDAEDVFQPLEIGDPALAPVEVLPCTVNLMASQDTLVRQSGPYVLRKI